MGLQEIKTAALELEDYQQEAAALEEAVEAAEEEQQALQAHLRRRLAVLRWQHADAAVLDPRRSGLTQRQVASGCGF